jgi:hypothetical protein
MMMMMRRKKGERRRVEEEKMEKSEERVTVCWLIPFDSMMRTWMKMSIAPTEPGLK